VVPVSPIEDAIKATLDEDDAIVVGWAVVVAYQKPEHSASGCAYALAVSEGQMFHSVEGLLHRGFDLLQDTCGGDHE
jgi:hypothetical protein